MALTNKIVSADEATAIIRDGDTVCVSGFVGIGTPDELILALERRFLKTKQPTGLTLVFAAAPGDGKDRGLNRLAHEGLVKRVVGGHWALVPKLAELALDNRIEAYNLPLGCIAHLYREIAAHRTGHAVEGGLAHLRRPAPRRRQDQRGRRPRTWSSSSRSTARSGCSTRPFRSMSRSSAAPPPTRTATSRWSARRSRSTISRSRWRPRTRAAS